VADRWDEHADEVAMLVAALATDDDEPLTLAEKVMDIFATVMAVEVIDKDGNGGTVRHLMEDTCDH